MAFNIAPVIRHRFSNSSGAPLAGGKLYSYQAGTSIPQATATDSTGVTSNANPLILDANGEAAIWLDPTLSYKFVLKDSSDVLQWTVDNVIGALTSGAVSTVSLQDLSVTSAKLGNLAVTSGKIFADASVDGNRPVTTNTIRDAAITAAKLASTALDLTVVSKTTTYTAVITDNLILCSTSGGIWTLGLPTAVGNTGKILRIKKTDSSTNALTIDANASELIDGALTLSLVAQYESAVLVSDGTGWNII